MSAFWYVYAAMAAAFLAGMLLMPPLQRAFFYYLVPECKLLPSRRERAALYGRVRQGLGTWLSLPGVALVIGVLFMPKFFGSVPRELLILLVFWVVAGDLCVWYAFRQRVRRAARRRLVELGYPICIHCGYDLRAAICEICPECGKKSLTGALGPSAARPSGSS